MPTEAALPPLDKKTPLPGLLLLLVATGLALRDAARLSWLADDAFISFRYAKNLVLGHGLVFNPGEMVEGYTNFLWTMLLAGGMALGLAPEALSTLLGLLAFASTILLLGLGSLRVAREQGATAFWIPVAALCLAGMHHARVFASSGLETAAFGLLLLGAAMLAIEARNRAQWLGLGLLGALSLLTRPEGGLVLLMGGLIALLSGPGRWRALLALSIPAGLIILPWLGWKLAFYGDLLPNTWYAKAGTRWEQGLLYIGLFLRTYPVVGLGLLATPVLAGLRRFGTMIKGLPPGWSSVRAPLVLLLLSLPYLFHVAKVGGDFMFARFCLPVVPLLLLGGELLLQRLPRPAARLGLGLVIALGTALSPPPPELLESTEESWHGIVEERDWYPPFWQREALRQGEVIARMSAGTDLRAIYHGTQAMLMYYGEVPYALEPHIGLTDRELARMPAPEGARVGHGWKASLGYLQRRGIDIAFDFRVEQYKTRFTEIDLGQGVTGRILVYRRPVLEVLRSRGAVFLDLPAFLDAYIANMGGFTDEKVAEDYQMFQDFYFDHNDDQEREQAFRARLGG